mmetsp:Transcript_47783/g.147398  ORF Transcript_47783/g.147398 Transcript_47783/m.147398 type:complete len:341 (-) Transcript_47783:455-1477(-)
MQRLREVRVDVLLVTPCGDCGPAIAVDRGINEDRSKLKAPHGDEGDGDGDGVERRAHKHGHEDAFDAVAVRPPQLVLRLAVVLVSRRKEPKVEEHRRQHARGVQEAVVPARLGEQPLDDEHRGAPRNAGGKAHDQHRHAQRRATHEQEERHPGSHERRGDGEHPPNLLAHAPPQRLLQQPNEHAAERAADAEQAHEDAVLARDDVLRPRRRLVDLHGVGVDERHGAPRGEADVPHEPHLRPPHVLHESVHVAHDRDVVRGDGGGGGLFEIGDAGAVDALVVVIEGGRRVLVRRLSAAAVALRQQHHDAEERGAEHDGDNSKRDTGAVADGVDGADEVDRE